MTRQQIIQATAMKERNLIILNPKKKEWSPIPLFNRVRRVYMEEQNCLQCSCFQFESTGLPCHHVACVIRFCFPEWQVFSHHDCGIKWWKIWHHYAYCPNNVGICAILAKTKQVPVTGPYFPSDDKKPPATIDPYKDPISIELLDSVRNYSQSKILQLLGKERFLPGSQTTNFEGLSQSDYIVHDNDDDAAHFEPIMEDCNDDSSTSMFEHLKHAFYELLSVLETHNKEYPNSNKCDEIRGLMQEQINSMRLQLADVLPNVPKKWKATKDRIINIITEAHLRTTPRL